MLLEQLIHLIIFKTENGDERMNEIICDTQKATTMVLQEFLKVRYQNLQRFQSCIDSQRAYFKLKELKIHHVLYFISHESLLLCIK